jgi:hypothetical protein
MDVKNAAEWSGLYTGLPLAIIVKKPSPDAK